MAWLGLGPRFLGWFALTWLLGSFATGIGFAINAAGNAQPLLMVLWAPFAVILMGLMSPSSLAFSLGLSGLVWSVSWVLGRRQGLDARWNACLAALSCGLVTWALSAVALNGMPRMGGMLDITPMLPFLVVSAGFPALIGPPVAAHLFARCDDQQRRQARPAHGAAN